MAIKILPARLANQIAAGEVVERPSSVVKELVENSLDAGATSIHIQLERGGSKLIRIRDNGSGIAKDDLTLALSRHATSKISSVEDLENILSLGFRGEALASISSVSRLKLTSKPAEQNEAWLAYAEGRDMEVTVEPAAHPDGTTIEVSDLFFNTPARRKFLRTDKTEFHHIDEMLKRIALSRFDVAFQLEHNGKAVRRLRACDTPEQREQRVAQLCSRHFMQNALQASANHHGLYLSGWIAHPDSCKQQNDIQYSFVNGRMMRDKLLNHAIRQAYNEFIPDECHPAFILYLTLDAHQVDVNVHPAKHEVRFHQARLVHDFVVQAIESAFAQIQTSHATEDLYQTELHDDGNVARTSSLAPQNQIQETATPYIANTSSTPEFSLEAESQTHSIEHSTRQTTMVPTTDQGRGYSGSYHSNNSSDYPGQTSRLQFSSDSRNSDRPSSKQLKHYDRSLQQFAAQPATSPLGHTETNYRSETPVTYAATTEEMPATAAQVIREQKPQVIDAIKLVTVLKQRTAIAVFNDELWQINLNSLEESQLTSMAQQNCLKPQPLLLPVRIALHNEQDHNQVEQLTPVLQQIGIEIQQFAQHLIVKKVPAFIRKTDVTSWFDALMNIELNTIEPTQVIPQLLNKMLQIREAQAFTLESASTLLQRSFTSFEANCAEKSEIVESFLRTYATKIELTA